MESRSSSLQFGETVGERRRWQRGEVVVKANGDVVGARRWFSASGGDNIVEIRVYDLWER
jgi:hypothetical protein